MIPKTKTICCPMNGRGFHKERLFFKSLALRKRKKKKRETTNYTRKFALKHRVWFCSLGFSPDMQNKSQNHIPRKCERIFTFEAVELCTNFNPYVQRSMQQGKAGCIMLDHYINPFISSRWPKLSISQPLFSYFALLLYLRLPHCINITI